MTRVDHMLLGYVTFTVSEADTVAAMDRLLKKGLSAKFNSYNSFNAPVSRARSFKDALGDISYSVSSVKGFLGLLYRMRHRYGILFALLSIVFLSILSSWVVWDVRVEGGDGAYDEGVLSELESLGLRPGAIVSDEELSKIEVGLLANSNRVGWINLNRRGGVIYANIVLRDDGENDDGRVGYASIVAEYDGVIEEITVKEGIARVKPGDTVKKGQVLISGVIPTELGGGYCYASGCVTARRITTVSVDVGDTVSEKVVISSQSGGFNLDFFGLQTNILKKYGNQQESCDIIEKKYAFDAFGKRIPISLTKYTVEEYVLVERVLAKEELLSIARDDLTSLLLDASSSGEILSVKTYGEFYDRGYRMWADVILRDDITEIKEFDFIQE